MNDIEQEIQAKGLTAPRITPDDVEASIAHEFYFHPHEALIDAARFEFLTRDHDDANLRAVLRDLMERMRVMSAASVRADIDTLMGIRPEPHESLRVLTFCVLVLRNGHRIVGVNEGPVSASNFDAGLGRKLARQKAVDQIWPLLGYELRSKLAAVPADFRDRVRAEAYELDDRIKKLAAFLPSDTFGSLPKGEQDRLTAQLAAMQDYSNCLAERIRAFGRGA